MYKNKGFTLIELLVSIAIITVLTGVVILAISDAKNKNVDAAVKQALSSIPAQSGIFHLDNGGTFTGFCVSDTPKSAYPIVLNAANNVNLSGITVNNTGTLTTATCNNTASAWAAEVPLKNKNIGGTGKSNMFCVDSTGFVGNRMGTIGNSVTCPTE